MDRNPKTEAMLAAEMSASGNLKNHGKRISSGMFAIRNMSVLAYANGFTLWHYKAGKTRLETVAEDDFFADAADMLAVGDMVMVSALDGARVLAVALADVGAVVTAPMA